ncbi:hypothetical protein AAMO2058_001213100, partial [Amorphochlora amoebiformis]
QFQAMSLFPEKQRKRASGWQKQLEKRPRRRSEKKQKVKKQPDYDDLDSEDEPIQEKSSRSRRKRRRPRPEVDLGSESEYDAEPAPRFKKKSKKSGGSGGSGKVFNSRICDKCNKPGSLLLCDNHCERGFHLHCLGEEAQPLPQEGTMWQCVECAAQVHRCFACKKVGRVETLDGPSVRIPDAFVPSQTRQSAIEQLKLSVEGLPDPVRRCSVSTCGRYYHLECIAAHSSARWIGDVSLGYSSFRCPLHYCAVCEKSGNSKHLLNCVRCPNALHVSCLEKNQYTRLTKKFMLCPRCHLAAMETEEGREIIQAASSYVQFVSYKTRNRVVDVNARKKRSKKSSRLKLKLSMLKRPLVERSLASGKSYNVRFVDGNEVILEKKWRYKKRQAAPPPPYIKLDDTLDGSGMYEGDGVQEEISVEEESIPMALPSEGPPPDFLKYGGIDDVEEEEQEDYKDDEDEDI